MIAKLICELQRMFVKNYLINKKSLILTFQLENGQSLQFFGITFIILEAHTINIPSHFKLFGVLNLTTSLIDI